MTRHRGTHTNKLLRKLGQKWGEWENRQWVADHPLAPTGLIDAWCNDRFAVQHFAFGGQEWLSIRRHHDGASPPTWAEMQRIKNELVGPERVGVEVFPKASELVDDADMFHIWLYPEGENTPFNFISIGWSKPTGRKSE